MTHSQTHANYVMKPDYQWKMGLMLFPKKINDVDIDLSVVKKGFEDALGPLGKFITVTYNPPDLLKMQHDDAEFQALFWKAEPQVYNYQMYDWERVHYLVSDLAGGLYPQVLHQASHVIITTPYNEQSISRRLMKTFMLEHLGERTGMDEMTYILPEPSQTIYDLNDLPEGTIDDPIYIKTFVNVYNYALEQEALATVPEHVNRTIRRRQEEEMLAAQRNLKRKADEAELLDEERRKNRKLDVSQESRCAQYTSGCQYQPLDYEDWCDHPYSMYWGLENNGKCFDISELLSHIEVTCLGATKYTNPYPQYPYDPFDRHRFTETDFEQIAEIASANRILENYPKFIKFMEWLSRQPQEIRNNMLMLGFDSKTMESYLDYVKGQSGGAVARLFTLVGLI